MITSGLTKENEHSSRTGPAPPSHTLTPLLPAGRQARTFLLGLGQVEKLVAMEIRG